MPWSGQRSRKLATQVGMVLGYAASVPINLASTWLQVDILPNPLYFVFAIVLAFAALYWQGVTPLASLASLT